MLEPLTTGARWEDLRVPASSRAALEALAQRRGRGVLALFTGPAGTGKTLAAVVVASRLGVPAYRVDMARVVSKYIGETEKNLDRVFDAEEAAGAVLFFDEADALFGKRTEVRDAHDRYASQEIGYFLSRVEAHEGPVIVTTTRKADIAPALLKRLTATVGIPRRLA